MHDIVCGDGIYLEPDLNKAYMRKLISLGQARSFNRNEYLYFQGDKADHVYVLKTGTVKATFMDENGHETLLIIHGPGNVLGLSALRPAQIRDASGIAIEKAETACFSRDKFVNYLRDDMCSDGQLGVLLLRVLLKRQQQLHARVSDFASHSVEQRTARILFHLHAEAAARTPRGADPLLTITHEELASLVVSRRQYVTVILKKFASDGLIDYKRRRIRVVDPVRLSQVYQG